MFVKPAPDRAVPDPERGGLLPPEGRDVPDTSYWLRRVTDNDVVKDEPDAVQTSAKKKAS